MFHTIGVVIAAISLFVLICAAVYFLVIQTHEVDNMDMSKQPMRHRDEEDALSRRPQEDLACEPLRRDESTSHDTIDLHEDETITIPIAQVDEDGRIHLRPGIDSSYDLVSKSVRMFYPEGEMPHRHVTHDDGVIEAELIDDDEEEHPKTESNGSTRLDGEVVNNNNDEREEHDDEK